MHRQNSAVQASHFSWGHKLHRINASQALIPFGISIPAHERPALWYSSRLDFEPTSLKPLQLPGSTSIQKVSFADLHSMVGAYRFVADPSALRIKPWPECAREIGIMPFDRSEMESVGRGLGANPLDWFATVRKQPLHMHRFEAWDGTHWIPANLETEVSRRADLGNQFASATTGVRWREIGAG